MGAGGTPGPIPGGVDATRVLDGLPDGVAVIDGDIRLVWVNRRFRELTGWTDEDLLGRSGLDLLDPDQIADALDALAIASETPHVLPPGAYRIAHADGRYVTLELHAAPVDPGDPSSLTAMMARPVEHHAIATEGIELLNAGGPMEGVAEFVVHRLGWIGGEVVVVFDDDVTGERRSVHAGLPDALVGVATPPDGPAPWDEVAATGEPVERTLDELPPSIAEVARAEGFVACTADCVPDPGGRDALVILWFRADAPPSYRFLFREEPRYLLLRLALERRSIQRSLHRAATVDALTGLANRARFFDVVEHRRLGPCALLYLDLDDFKPVNDAHGHRTGDAVLAEIGRRLLANVREGDVAARIGGDEFAVYCPGVDAAEAEAIAERIRLSVAEPVDLPEGRMTVGSSVGVAVSTRGLTPLTDLLDAADRLLYETKRSGKQGCRTAVVG